MTQPHSPATTNRNEAVLWHTLAAPEVAERLGSDSEFGLSTAEAEARLIADGPNRLDEKPKTPAWRLFVSQYNDFMIYVLLVAVGISAFEGQVPESIAILAILLLNGVLGFVQEYRAEKALDALKQLSAPIATVIRDGAESDIPAERARPRRRRPARGRRQGAGRRSAHRGGGPSRRRVRTHRREQARPQARQKRYRSPTRPSATSGTWCSLALPSQSAAVG